MSNTFEDDLLTLEKLHDEWDADSAKGFDQTDPTGSEVRRMQQHAKYLRINSHHHVNVVKIEDELQDMRRIRTQYYDGALSKDDLDARGWDQYLGKSPKTNQQRDELLESDPFIKEITKRKRVYETIVKATEYIIKELGTRGYTIKALIDWEKMRNGG